MFVAASYYLLHCVRACAPRRYFQGMLLLIVLGSVSTVTQAQSCVYYLNATNGDDDNSGTRPELAVRSFEHAFRAFPSESVVCMTAGEYFHSLDADGIQLTGPELAGKNMRFVLQSFAGATEVAFTEDELRIDIGDGRVEFVAGSTDALRVGSGTINSPSIYPANTTFLHTLVLSTGMLDVSGVDFTIGTSVGNPDFRREDSNEYVAPDSATIGRGTGSLNGALTYAEAPRSLTYIGSGDRSAGNEVPPLLSRLLFWHDSGTVTLSGILAFTDDPTIQLVGAGDARIESRVDIPAASSTVVVVAGAGQLDLSGPFTTTITGTLNGLARVESGGHLILRHLNMSSAQSGQSAVATLVNSGFGLLDIRNAETGPGANLLLINEGAGSCSLGSPGSDAIIAADLVNESGGHCVIEDETEVRGEIENRGRITLRGSVSQFTAIGNAGTILLAHDATIYGTLHNDGEIELASYFLTISGPGPHENTGRILSSNGIGSMRLVSSTRITGDGQLPNLISSSGTHFVSGSTVLGSVEIESEADLTLEVVEVDEMLSIEGGVGRVNVRRAASLEISSGSLTLQRDLFVQTYLQQSGSSLDLATHTLALTGSFTRLGGSIIGGGGLLFHGSGAQTLSPGIGLHLGKIILESGDVQLTSGPVYVRDSLVVNAGSTLHLFDYVLQLNGDRTVVVNNGEVSTSTTGRLVFGGAGGSRQSMTGTGLFGNIEIAMEDETDRVSVQNANLGQGGVLTLGSGQLRLSEGSIYSLLAIRGTPLIRRNLSDTNGDGEPAGKAIDANSTDTGSFFTPDGGFNLEYFGTLDGAATMGAESLLGQIVNLTVQVSGPLESPAVLSLAGELSIAGDLQLAATAILDLGLFDLSATGTGRTHEIGGRIESSGGAFAIRGSSATIRGDEQSPSSIEILRIDSDGQVVAASIHSIGNLLEMTSGSLLLGGSNSSSANIARRLLVNGGKVTFASNLRILDSVRLTGGTLDLDRHDLIMETGATFVTSESSVIASGREGMVVFTGDGQIRSNGTSVPKLRLASDQLSTLTMIGDVEVEEALIIESGALDLSIHTLTLSGGRWELLGGQVIGSGDILIAGPVEAALAISYTIPNLTVRSYTSEGGLYLKSLSNPSKRMVVSGRLSVESGVFDLGLLDVVIGGPGKSSTFTYEGGRIAMVSGNTISDAANGELELSNTLVNLKEPLSIANIRVSGSSGFQSDSAPLEIQRQITFVNGMLDNDDPNQIRLADGSRIVRRGTGSFTRRPTLENGIDLYYSIRDASLEENLLETGREIPASGSLRRFTVDAGPNVLRLSESVAVVETLRLDSGTFDRNGFALRVNSGATVHYDNSTPTAPAFAGGSFQPDGPVRLVYSGTRTITSDDLTFPPDIQVSQLVVEVGSFNGKDAVFRLHARRSVENLVVNGRSEFSGLDLNGSSVLVESDVHLRSGVIRSSTEAILEVGDSLIVGENGAIRDVVGVLARGHTVIGGLFDGYVLRAYGNVTVTGELGTVGGEPTANAGVIVDGLPNLELSGSNQILRLERGDSDADSVDDSVNRLIMTATGTVRLEHSGNVAFTLGVNNLELRTGLLETGINDLRLPHDGQGFRRDNEALSHVVGRISRHVHSDNSGLNGVQTMRYEYPVGGSGPEPSYRPVFFSLTEDDPLDVNSIITVGHQGRPAGGLLGFPIGGGSDFTIGDASGFFWTLSARPALSTSQTFSLGVIGTGLEAYSAARNLRLIHRSDGSPSDHAWRLVGSPSDYDNAVVSVGGLSVPFVQVLQMSDGIPAEPNVLAIGMEASEIDFARLQVAHLIGRNGLAANVVVDDSIEATGLRFGEATPYFRVTPGRRLIKLVAESGSVIAKDTLVLEAGQDYVVTAVIAGRHDQPHLVIDEAQAIPTMVAKDDVSLAFFNGIPDAPPLSLRTRDSREILFADISFAGSSNEYAILEAANTGFDVLSTSTSETLFSLRTDLTGHAGQTVYAFAAGYLNPFSHGASERGRLFLFTNHGHPVSAAVQVVTERHAEIPATFALHGNYPNPFNPSTRVVFDLPESSEVTVEVIDLLGRTVMRWGAETLAAGRQGIQIDASELTSGVYVYRVLAQGAGTYSASGKMTLVR